MTNNPNNKVKHYKLITHLYGIHMNLLIYLTVRIKKKVKKKKTKRAGEESMIHAIYFLSNNFPSQN